jgi:hypothetical protein
MISAGQDSVIAATEFKPLINTQIKILEAARNVVL